MILGAATVTFLATALFLTMPGQASAGSDPNAGAAPSASPSPGGANVTLSGLPSGVTEVMKMYKGGIPADIIVSYINNSPLTFYLSADNIISFQQQGVPMPVINAMINRYGQLQRQTGMAAGGQAQVPGQAPAPQYYSYAAGNAAQSAADSAAASYDAALQAQAAAANASSAYVAAPAYPAYEPYYAYDPYYYPWYPFGGSLFFGYGGYYGGGFGHGGFGHGGFGGRVGGFGGGGRVGGFGGGGHVGGFGGGGHVGGFGGGGHVGGFSGGAHVGGGGFSGGAHGGGGGGGHR